MPVIATGRAAGIPTIGVGVALAISHAHCAKLAVFLAEVWGVVLEYYVFVVRGVTVGIGADNLPSRIGHVYRSTVLLEQYLSNLGHCWHSLVTGLHGACTRDAMATAGSDLSIDNLVAKTIVQLLNQHCPYATNAACIKPHT